MQTIRRPLARFFAIDARSTKISAGNGVPTAADILYRNPGAIENRMQLFHLYRLRVQLKLDGPRLEAMAKPWCIDETKQIVRVTTRCADNVPGIESQFDPEHGAVDVTVPVSKLGLTKDQEQLIIKLAGHRYDVDLGLIRFEVSDFPFKEQNQAKVMEILRNLIAYVKSPDSDQFTDVPVVSPGSRRKAHLEFPSEWLPKLSPSA